MPHIDLLHLPWFANIPLSEVVSLIDAMAPQQFDPGQSVVTAGTVPSALVVATAGAALVQAGALAADGLSGPEVAAPPSLVEAPFAAPVTAFFARTLAPHGIVAHTRLSVFLLSHERFELLLSQRHVAIAPFLRNLLASQAGLQPCRCVG